MANDVISYDEYQKLPEEEKQNFETHWNSDGKSGRATRKGAKLAEVKSTVPVNGMGATNKTPSKDEALSQFELDLKNGKFDAKDVNGNYAYSFDELVKYRDKYRAEGNDVWKKFQEAINGRPEGKAEIAARKKAAADAEAKRKAEEEEAAKKKEEELKTGGSNRNTESALKDTKAEDEALDKKQEALDKVLDKAKTSREELDEEWDELLRKNEAASLRT